MGTVETSQPDGTEVITNALRSMPTPQRRVVGNVTNTCKMTARSSATFQGKLTNSGTQLKIGTANVTG